jgi:hypothetical protein
MKRYFKRTDAEPPFPLTEAGISETGVFYIEVTNRWPTRQVEIYGNVWLWGDDAHPKDLADQPFEDFAPWEEFAISPEEFELVWQEALQRRPP